jgi:hypothetical protein
MDKLCDFNLSIGGIRNKMKFYDLEFIFFIKKWRSSSGLGRKYEKIIWKISICYDIIQIDRYIFF